MRKAPNTAWVVAALGMAVAGPAVAEDVTDNIEGSVTWHSDTVYNLTTQIYVLPGATLTIEPGTIIASAPTANGGGSLAVCRGAQIFVNGTRENPVIMTSTNDTATWTDGDPQTGTWRAAANEWGNLTLMGAGLISASHFMGNPVIINGVPNTKEPTGLNQKQMEGLVAANPGDTNVLYGGADDNDDSGSISYLSIRYAGRVVGLGNELNGLSLGGIGRETDIHHVDIMNNVDDGVEIWGGTVNLKFINIWNVGDDSFDVDEGWRGKAQFILAVQGYSLNASQGSGVGDNAFETDGAEDSDAQPVSTAVIANATVIGQPFDGDHGTTWRDNARIQYHACIFMDLGEELVRFDNVDGDGAQGYGFNGTLSWPDTWTTDYTVTSVVNAAAGAQPGDFNSPEVLYQAQTSGKLAEITGSVFYHNNHAAAYTQAGARGVLDAGNNNIQEPVDSPVANVTRGAPIVVGGKVMAPVTSLDPRGTNDALVPAALGGDGFFTPAQFRGAFGPGENWLCGWTAAAAYGMTVPVPCPGDLDGSGTVDTVDFLSLLAAWGNCGDLCPADINCDGKVDTVDFLALLANWGPC